MNRSCFFSMGTKNKKDDEKGLWTKESKKCHIYLLFLSILIIHTVAISLFTRGFLLTRTELSSSFSSCDDNINESPPSPCYTTPPNSTKDQCWTNPSVDRIVIIVLDALRIDFVAPSTFFDDAEMRPWMDKLTVLQKLAATSPSSARLFKAIADPPTTSLQRLKGLTTGGLPTFIDIGNSFGAPAIVEDNLIYQLAKNGKRVLMMGDDTWLQLFPDHFNKSYPYPSFNVKDLDTVDDGCIEHLLPSLYNDDWDVLIAHFLGVDHAGHIFGVDSAPMIQKLEQYNSVLETVIDILKKQSEPGDIHENTFLIVMGDHGQTTNGDHGGGTAEEVETSIFGMSLKGAPVSISSLLDSNSCRSNVDGENVCIGSIQQIDFAVTISALIGIPFPFGSIGRVNPELYALSGGTWDVNFENQNHKSDLVAWMQNYANTLCINCWQVKRYIDLYSVTSAFGFPDEDLQLVSELYTKAQESWSSSIITANTFNNDASSNVLPILRNQINVYSHFLEKVAELARSKWTEFDLTFMGIGLGVLFISLFLHIVAIMKVHRLFKSPCSHINNSWTLSRVLIPLLLVGIRANSFLSNSYILEEGKVANFFLATTAIISTQNAIIKGKIAVEEISFLMLNIVLRYSFEPILSKQNNLINNDIDPSILAVIAYEAFPIISMLLLAYLFYKRAYSLPSCETPTTFMFGALLSYLLLALHWVSESRVIEVPSLVQYIGKTIAPQTIYSIGFVLVLFAFVQAFLSSRSTFNDRRILAAFLAMMCAWSPTIIMLLGRQGPMVAFISLFGVWCIIRLQNLEQNYVDVVYGRSVMDLTSITQWNLLAVSLFFYSGHWCMFDGLRYGAAFIGFDNFNFLRQGALLALDTFGISHILPIFGLPILFFYEYSGEKQASSSLFGSLTQAFLIYGFETAATTTFALVSVAIHRRHLMVWGLFAPKFVFDAVGLILTDFFIFLASLYYF